MDAVTAADLLAAEDREADAGARVRPKTYPPTTPILGRDGQPLRLKPGHDVVIKRATLRPVIASSRDGMAERQRRAAEYGALYQRIHHTAPPTFTRDPTAAAQPAEAVAIRARAVPAGPLVGNMLQRFRVTLAHPADSLDAFAKTAIAETVRLTPAGGRSRAKALTFIFEDGATGTTFNRTLALSTSFPKGPQTRRLANFLDNLIATGPVAAGSDELPTEVVPDLQEFYVDTVAPPVGGAGRRAAPKHPTFVLVDHVPAEASAGDCLLHQLRGETGLHKGIRGPRLREMAGLPRDGDLPAAPETFRALGQLFQRRVRLLDGYQALPDDARVFDDNLHRRIRPNACLSPPQLMVAVEGGDAAETVDLVLVGDHYFAVRSHLPPPACPITGDLEPPADFRARVLAQGRPWFGAEEPAKQPGGPKTPNLVIAFDYETVFDRKTGELQPYCLAWFPFAPGRPGGKDFAGERSKVRITFATPSATSAVEVTRGLLDYIEALSPDTTATLLSFNGCRFDNFLLAQAASTRQNLLRDLKASPGKGVREISLGRHMSLDLCAVVASSLDKACHDFGTSPKKVPGFSHAVPQRAHLEGRFAEWLAEESARLTEYAEGDVLSLASLFVSVSATLKDLGEKICPDSSVSLLGRSKKPSGGQKGRIVATTVAGLAFEMMKAACPDVPTTGQAETDADFRAAITGGRVQRFGPPRVVRNADVSMVDFCSLYPTVMAAPAGPAQVFENLRGAFWGWYPSPGQRPREVGPGTDPLAGPGIYLATITKQPAVAVVPRRSADAPLDWEPEGTVEGWLTHTDASLILGNGGALEVRRGYQWHETQGRTGAMAPFIDKLVQVKNEEDAKPKGEQNSSLRALAKLLMNSASGKTVQRAFLDRTELADNGVAALAAERLFNEEVGTIWIPMRGGQIFLVGQKTESTEPPRPVELGVFIYSYARALLWKVLLAGGETWYGDTDSALLSRDALARVRNDYPQLFPDLLGRKKQLGDLEEELGEYTCADVYLARPKLYAIDTRDKDGHATAGRKVRIKGANLSRDRLWLAEQPPPKDLGEAFELMEGDRAEAPPLKDSVPAFFERVIEGGGADVLTGQLQRTYKDEASPFALRQVYGLKRFTL